MNQTTLRKTLGLLWSTNRWHTVSLLLLTVLDGILPVANLYLSKLMLDAVGDILAGTGDTSPLIALAGVQVAVLALNILSGNFRSYVVVNLTESIRNNILQLIFSKVKGSPFKAVEESTFQDLLRNAYLEAGQRPLDILRSGLGLLQMSITITSVAVILAELSPWLLLVLLLLAIPRVAFEYYVGKKQYKLMRERAERMRHQEYLSRLLTHVQHLKEVRSYRLEPQFRDLYKESFKTFMLETRHISRMQLRFGLVNTGLLAAGSVYGLNHLINQVARGGLTIGDYSLYLGSFISFQAQVTQILRTITDLSIQLMYARNLFDFLELEANPPATPREGLAVSQPGDQPCSNITNLSFKNVSFSYSKSPTPALSNISFSVTAGSTLAIVGENGSGKSTLMKLICGLYEPEEGEITVNGFSRRAYAPGAVESQVAPLFQDYQRYQTTVEHNIRFGNLQRTESILPSLDWMGLSPAVARLVYGPETFLGRMFSEGTDLSGGQWQRLALARMHYRGASLVVLDEPTSALDVESQNRLAEWLVTPDDTIKIIISHQASLAAQCDHVICLREGRIIESGTPGDLLAAKGYFYGLSVIQEPFAEALERQDQVAAPA